MDVVPESVDEDEDVEEAIIGVLLTKLFV